MKRSLFGIYHPVHKVSLLLADIVCISASFHLSIFARLNRQPDLFTIEYIGLNIIIITCLFLTNSYSSGELANTPKIPFRTFFNVLASSLPCILFIYILGPDRFTELFGRGVFPTAIVSFGILAILSRFLINSIFNEKEKYYRIFVIGNINEKSNLDSAITSMQQKINVNYSKNLSSEIKISSLDAVVLSPVHELSNDEQRRLINLRLAGVSLFSISDFFENFLFLIPVREINNDWFLRTQGFSIVKNPANLRVKRIVDLLLASTLLIISTPLMLIAALTIKLSDWGPIIFSQTRVGMNGKQFKVYKFRSMELEAEKNGAQWASSNDNRILAVGYFLRKTRIDELPQCWNIIKGEMSFIGPRPERPEFTQELAKNIPYYELRHVIKPGLSGWAQVSYPYGSSAEDSMKKLQYDLYYIKNYSLLLDFNILLRTILVIIRRTGR